MWSSGSIDGEDARGEHMHRRSREKSERNRHWRSHSGRGKCNGGRQQRRTGERPVKKPGCWGGLGCQVGPKAVRGGVEGNGAARGKDYQRQTRRVDGAMTHSKPQSQRHGTHQAEKGRVGGTQET